MRAKYFQILRIFPLRGVQNVSILMGRGGDAAHNNRHRRPKMPQGQPITRAQATAEAQTIIPQWRRRNVRLTVDCGVRTRKWDGHRMAFAFVTSSGFTVRVTRREDGSLYAREW